MSLANNEDGPKKLKSGSCEAESCFPGYRIIETTANGSWLFEAIAHQLVARTYNVPAPSVHLHYWQVTNIFLKISIPKIRGRACRVRPLDPLLSVEVLLGRYQSCVRENPAMTAEVNPEGLYNHNAQGLVWAIEHCV